MTAYGDPGNSHTVGGVSDNIVAAMTSGFVSVRRLSCSVQVALMRTASPTSAGLVSVARACPREATLGWEFCRYGQLLLCQRHSELSENVLTL